MLNYFILTFFKHFIEIEFKIISIRKNRDTCESNCNHLNGHLPYLFEGISPKINSDLRFLSSILKKYWSKVENVLEKIFTNKSLDRIRYPMLDEKFGRSGAYPNLTQIKVNVLLGKNNNNNSLRLATVMQRSPD